LVAGAALLILAKPWWAKAVGLIYPVCMLIAVVVTGNHYLLDVVAGIIVVVMAYGAANLLDRWWNNPDRQQVRFRGIQSSAP
jgi:membrane-associated phospholipid phosphatase